MQPRRCQRSQCRVFETRVVENTRIVVILSVMVRSVPALRSASIRPTGEARWSKMPRMMWLRCVRCYWFRAIGPVGFGPMRYASTVFGGLLRLWAAISGAASRARLARSQFTGAGVFLALLMVPPFQDHAFGVGERSAYPSMKSGLAYT